MNTSLNGLLIGINNKDMEAWECLYADYYATLCSYVNRIVRDKNAAQDIVQDLLVSIWKSPRQFLNMRDFSMYLYRSCYNNALIYIRNRNLRWSIEQRMARESANTDEEMFAITIEEELIRQLYVYIQELPEKGREIINLMIQGFSGPEIAEKLGVTIHTVKTHKSRVFKYLRSRYKNPLLFFVLGI
ncbi:sigma-70 family RNA polymerase sigma factor [uncultured Sanguibacteroides sp.]|uniref:RNA polymerase sigma factor n=1 Tax=uncultured Sanguibacteroides sp. TaxID=1635151 RepID=UPI0025D54C4C|nr:sigma-70 family RNA polymerase sigma factor [uncultured Sanguibacteroides sp.]